MSKGSKNKTIQENSTIQEYPDGKKREKYHKRKRSIKEKKKTNRKLLLLNIGRNYDATAVRNIAQEWIDKHMKNR